MLGDVVGMQLVMILDPIYDTKDHLQTLPLQLPQQISFDQWQQGDEVFTCSFQNTKDDPWYLVFQMIFSLTLRCLMSMLST
jgi:hypothetical protein